MNRDVSTTAAAARALGARTPVTFTCVHPIEESIRRLAAITDPPVPLLLAVFHRESMREQLDHPMAPVPQRPKGFVDATTVRLEWDRVRFEGHWSSRLDVALLEGVMVPHGVARTVVPPFAMATFFVVATAMSGGGYWLAGILLGLILVAMPLLVTFLGSARVAAEIELERIIGSTIGDPEKYATRWRRWRDE